MVLPQGIYCCIGLNRVDPGHYQGWDGALNACENDARDMATIAASQGFAPAGSNLLLSAQATQAGVTRAITAAALRLQEGDIFLISFSGHGGQIPDLNGDESDCLDETWCLFDRQMLDDELYRLWENFKPGVRVLIFSDSCHSGSVVKAPYHSANCKSMPRDVSETVFMRNQELYNPLLARGLMRRMDARLQASLLFISGCQDNQTSADGFFNGLFTYQLKKVWNQGAFAGDYRKFHGAIVALMPPEQTPNYVFMGRPNPGFEAQKPFTV